MLMKSDIDPFDSQETKPYKNDPRISAMTDLVHAYQNNDIHTYEKVLQSNKEVLSDPFIAENIDEVTRELRTKAVLKLVSPYTRFTLAFLAKQLKISTAEVQEIVGFLIVDKKLNGRINQERGIVEIENNTDVDRTRSMQEWTSAIRSLCKAVLDDGEGFRPDDSSQMVGASAVASLPYPSMDVGGMMNDGGRAGNGTAKLRMGQKKGAGRAQTQGFK